MPHLSEMQSQHAAGLALLAKAVAGNSLTSGERADAEFFLAGLTPVITQNPHLASMIYNSAMAARPRDETPPIAA
jgi:hypothetical protein